MEFDNATTHRHTGQEFTGVEGFGEVVICAGCQPADDVIFVCIASEQDDVQPEGRWPDDRSWQNRQRIVLGRASLPPTFGKEANRPRLGS